MTGVELNSDYAFAETLEILLGIYSAVIIATIAGALGAYFVQAKADPPPVLGPWWENGAEPAVKPHVSD